MNRLLPLTLILVLAACGQKSTQEYLDSGKAKLEQQDLAAAIIEFKNAVKSDPNSGEARFLLGQAYLTNKQYEFAQKELERALEYQYDTKKLLPLLSETFQKTGSDKALLSLSLDNSLKTDELAKIKFYQVQAHMRLDQMDRAEYIISEIRQLATDSPYKSLALVMGLLIKQQPDAAKMQLNEVIASFPKHPDALKIKARLQLQEGDVKGAAESFQVYVDANPDDLDMTFVLARLYNDTEQFDKSEPLIDHLLTINDKQPVLNQLKAIARMKANDYQSALEYAEKSLLEDVESIPTRVLAGFSAYFLKNYEVANQHLSLVVSELPASHPGLRMLADSQLKLGLTLDANETMQQFDQITEQDVALASGIGQALLREGNIKQARMALTNQPETVQSPVALANVGLLKLSLNDVDGILDLESSLKQAQSDESTQVDTVPVEEVLVKAYLSTQQYDKALEIAQRWKLSEQHKTRGFLLAGTVLLKQQKPQLAKNEFKIALQQTPNNPSVKLSLLNQEPLETKVQQDAFLANLEQLLASHPDYVPAILKHYILTKQLQRPVTMTKHLLAQIEKNPENKVLPAFLGQIYTLEKQPELAVEQFESILTDQPQPFWTVLASNYQKLNRIKAFEQLNNNWVKHQPNHPQAILGQVILLESRGKTQDALELTQHYFEQLGGAHLDLKLMHIHLLLKVGKFDEAKGHFEPLSEQVKNSPFSKGVLGQFQLRDKQYQAALSNLSIAYESRPTSQNASLMFAAIYNTSGEDAAYQFLNKHLKAVPSDQISLMRLANMQLTKDRSLAIKSYVNAVAINDQNFVAHNNLAFLYMEKNALDQALNHAQKAKSLRPNDASVLDTLGVIQLKRGEHEQALESLELAIDNMGEKVRDAIYVNYIEALLVNKQTALAKRKMQQHQLTEPAAQKKMEELKVKYL